MNERERMQRCYELAFHPPSLLAFERELRTGLVQDLGDAGELLDTALLLHQALPADGYASQRALTRLAIYQANARAFGLVNYLRHLRARLGRPPLAAHEVPAHLVRDIGLPPFERPRDAPRNPRD